MLHVIEKNAGHKQGSDNFLSLKICTLWIEFLIPKGHGEL